MARLQTLLRSPALKFGGLLFAAALFCLLAVSANHTPGQPLINGRHAGSTQPIQGAEIVADRDEYSKTYATDQPNVFIKNVYSTPIHYKDSNGRWQDIDSALAKGPDGRYHAKAPRFAMDFAPDSPAASLSHIQFDSGHGLTVGFKGASSSGASVNSNSSEYFAIEPGVDAILSATTNGVVEDLVLHSAAAPTQYVFPLTLQGLTASIDQTTGAVLYRDVSGSVVGTTASRTMEDSSATGSDSHGVFYALQPDPSGGTDLVMTLDSTWLNSPSRKFPVTVDPTYTSTTPTDDTYVDSGFVGNNSTDGDLRIGTYDSAANIDRSFMHFSDIATALHGDNISAATLYMYNHWSWSCTGESMQIYRVNQNWSGSTTTTWPGPSTADYITGGIYAYGWSSSGDGGPSSCPSRWVGHNVQTAVANWASGAWADQGLMVKAGAESNNLYWKRYYSANTSGKAPYISVTYSGLPGTPTNVTAAANAPGQAYLTWTAPPDNGSTIVQYFITPTINGVSQGSFTGPAGNPAPTSWTWTGLNMCDTFSYQVQAVNANGYGPWSSSSNTVTITGTPTAPTGATATAGQNTAALSWTAPPTPCPAPLTGYSIKPTVNGTVQNPFPSPNGTTPSYTATSLNSCDTYSFAVAGTDSVGTGAYSTQSNTVTVTGAPVAPAKPTVTWGSNNSQATVRWTAPASCPALTDYIITVSPSNGSPYTIDTQSTSTTYAVPSLSTCVEYTFSVAGKNSVGVGASSVASDQVPGAVTTPTNPTAKAGPASATVAWGASASYGCPVSYQVTPYIGATAQSPKTILSPSLTSAVISGLSPGTAYTFKIVASATGLVSSSPATTGAITPPTPLVYPGSTVGAIGVFVGYADKTHGNYIPPLWPHGQAAGGAALDNGGLVVVNTGSAPIQVSSLTVTIGGYSESWAEQLPDGSVNPSFTLNPGDAEVAYDPNATDTGGDTSDVNGQLTRANSGNCAPVTTIPSVQITVSNPVSGQPSASYADQSQILNTLGFDVGVCGSNGSTNEGHNWQQIGGNPAAADVLAHNESEKPCFVCAGDPVNTDNGNFGETYSDFSIAGHGVPLHFSHSYNSLASTTDGILGYGWTGSYNMFVTQDLVVGNFTVHQETGSSVTFTPPYPPPPAPGQGCTLNPAPPPGQDCVYQFSAPTQVLASFSYDLTTGTYAFMRNQDQNVYTFNTRGELISETDRYGYKTTLAYTNDQLTTITDPEGRYLTLAYTTCTNGAGRLCSVTDSTGRQVAFSYTTTGDLQSVVDVGGGTTQFFYGATTPHLLTEVKDPNCSADTSGTCQGVNMQFDSSGRVTQQSDNLGRTARFNYWTQGLTLTCGTISLGASVTVGGVTITNATCRTDPKGHQILDYYANDELIQESKAADTSAPATWSYTYDPVTRGIASVTDPPEPGKTDHTVWTNQWNATGTLQSSTVTDTAGTLAPRTTSYTYYPNNDVHTMTNAMGIATTYSRDAANFYRLLSVSTPLCAAANIANCTGSNIVANQVTSYSYTDPAHPDDVTTMSDADQKTWQYAYDPYGNRVQMIDPVLDKTTWTYDSLDHVLTRVSPNGYVANNTPSQYTTTYGYIDILTNKTNAFGNVQTIQDPLGHVTAYHYDANQNVTSMMDGNQQTTSYHFDFDNEQDQIIRADSTQAAPDIWKTVFDADGNVYQQLDGSGATTAYTYDALNHLSSMQDPLLRTTTYVYDASGNRISATDPQSPAQTSTYTYDPAYELAGISYSDGRTPNVGPIDYYANGMRKDMTDGTGMTSYQYDSLGRLTQSVTGAGAQIQYGYDLRGLVTSVTYPGGTNSVSRAYDDAGRLHTVTDWLTNLTTFNYDADSNLTSIAYPNGITQAFPPDQTDHISGTSGVPQFSESYGRDGNNGVNSVNGSSYALDAVNRIKSVGSQGYGYDTADNVKQLSNGVVQTFDVANEVTSATQAISLVGTGAAGDTGTSKNVSVSFSASAVANDQVLLGVTFPASGNSVSTPSGYSVVTSATSTGTSPAETVLFRKTAVGGESSVTVSFSSRSVPKSIVAAVYRGVDPGSPIDQSSTGVGPASGGTAVTAPSITAAAAGEQLLMFMGATGNAGAGTWTPPTGMSNVASETGLAQSSLEAAGETLTASGATGSQTATFATSAQLDGILVALRRATTSFGYDTRGNRTSLAPAGQPTTAMQYDQEDRLTAYGSGASYAYNGDGLRMAKSVGGTTTQQTYDLAGGIPAMIQDGTTCYIYGPSNLPLEQISGSTVLYYHHDQLGSTRALSNSAGTVVGTATYDPFGRSTAVSGTTTPFGFAGSYTDSESGFTYLISRYYDPSTGQFTSRDPATSLTRHPYSYVSNNPLNLTDPMGLCTTVDPSNPAAGIVQAIDNLDPTCWNQQPQAQVNASSLAAANCDPNDYLTYKACVLTYNQVGQHPQAVVTVASLAVTRTPSGAAAMSSFSLIRGCEDLINGHIKTGLWDLKGLVWNAIQQVKNMAPDASASPPNYTAAAGVYEG